MGHESNNDDIDIAFVFELKAPMRSRLDALKNDVSRIVKKLQTEEKGTIRFGFIGYSDHFKNPEGHNDSKYMMHDLSSNLEEWGTKVSSLRTFAFRSKTADVLGGIGKAMEMQWRAPRRAMIIAGGAPAHGRRFHNDEVPDFFSDEGTEPHGLTVRKIGRMMEETGVSSVRFIRAEGRVAQMGREFYSGFPVEFASVENVDSSKFGRAVFLQIRDLLDTCTAVEPIKRSPSPSPPPRSPRRRHRSPSPVERRPKRSPSPPPREIRRRERRQQRTPSMSPERSASPPPLKLSRSDDSGEDPNFAKLPTYDSEFTVLNLPKKITDLEKPLKVKETINRKIKISPAFFNQNKERLVYHARDMTSNKDVDGRKILVKQFTSADPLDNTFRNYQTAAETQAVARFLSTEFNASIEPELETEMRFPSMHIGSHGRSVFLSQARANPDDKVRIPKDEAREIMDAFSHFTFAATSGFLLVEGLEGQINNLNSPTIHCPARGTAFGEKNEGMDGILAFFKKHKCSDYCEDANLCPMHMSDVKSVARGAMQDGIVLE